MNKKILTTIVKPDEKTIRSKEGYKAIIERIAKDTNYDPNTDYLIEIFDNKLKRA